MIFSSVSFGGDVSEYREDNPFQKEIARMAKPRGTGLLMARTDVDTGHEEEFNRWYDEEHIQRLCEVLFPGLLSC